MGHLRTPAKGPVKQQSPSDLVVSCVNKHLCHPRSSTIRPTLVLQRLCMQVQVAAGLEDPCVPRGEGQIYCYLHVPRTAACLNGNLCFVCSTCDTAMDLLSAHATRLAPEQARLAPTAPRCIATGAWDERLADHPASAMCRVSGVVPLAVGSNFGADGESRTGLDAGGGAAAIAGCCTGHTHLPKATTPRPA